MNNIRKYVHKWAWTVLLTFCIVGMFYPSIGIAAIVCMLAPVVVSVFKGRYWCGNFCPRGSFNDILVSKISKGIKVPRILKEKWFKLLFLVLLMSGFAIQIYFVWGSVISVGSVFVRMIIITTLLSIVLGTFFNHRTWCTICPMGTMANYVSSIRKAGKKPKNVALSGKKCTDCNSCARSCSVVVDVSKNNESEKAS
ncbi:4Fe-4S binding protein [Pseudobacteroides cellulosolvens]|uniref:4Fe-4S ferredoxin iron-sulfur binding domain-containing protein n=1 Tax=Pseudobacteroides cellulosolvens ATCC 35603 = DSM 2933 TaxID=398512 RepID=A0A0L6JNJ6_9FIRM|nr:4Fe-4S binding protein [Pseudobacteroides cellulosolvens]KNY27305.1 4Fe-4S ferredoxin iron-sulfur binding domain-containing protein [Pseudobacteroides cellulosolvens ATCC 35603 = DSM 2933]